MPDKSHLIIIIINTQGQIVVEVRVLTWKKPIFHFEIKSSTVQIYKVSKYKFAPPLTLKLYPQVLIGQAKLFDISAAIRIGRQMNLQPSPFSFGAQENAFYRGQFVIWPRVLTINRG